MNKKNEEAFNYLDSLIEYANGRLSQINNKINDSNNVKLHIILQLGLVMNYYVKNIRIALDNNILAANVLLRSLVEGFINIEYIMQEDSPVRAIAYLFQDFKTREKNVKTYKEIIKKNPSKSNIIPDLSSPKKCDEFLEKLSDEKKSILSTLNKDFGIKINKEDLKFLNIYNRAVRTNLESVYKILYPYLSGISHMSASGLKDLIIFDDNKYLIAPKDDDEETGKILETTFRIYLVSIEDLFKEFNLYIEEDFKHLRNISEKL